MPGGNVSSVLTLREERVSRTPVKQRKTVSWLQAWKFYRSYRILERKQELAEEAAGTRKETAALARLGTANNKFDNAVGSIITSAAKRKKVDVREVDDRVDWNGIMENWTFETIRYKRLNEGTKFEMPDLQSEPEKARQKVENPEKEALLGVVASVLAGDFAVLLSTPNSKTGAWMFGILSGLIAGGTIVEYAKKFEALRQQLQAEVSKAIHETRR